MNRKENKVKSMAGSKVHFEGKKVRKI